MPDKTSRCPYICASIQFLMYISAVTAFSQVLGINLCIKIWSMLSLGGDAWSLTRYAGQTCMATSRHSLYRFEGCYIYIYTYIHTYIYIAQVPQHEGGDSLPLHGLLVLQSVYRRVRNLDCQDPQGGTPWHCMSAWMWCHYGHRSCFEHCRRREGLLVRCFRLWVISVHVFNVFVWELFWSLQASRVAPRAVSFVQSGSSCLFLPYIRGDS